MNNDTTLDSAIRMGRSDEVPAVEAVTEGKPKYLAIVDMVEADIANGKWSPGERLPSNRKLAAIFNVTVSTISKAMSEAVRRGLVDTRVGSGTYIRGATAAGGGAEGVYDLALNTLPTSVVADVLESTIASRFSDGICREFFSYSDSYRAPRHQGLGARWLTAHGTPTREDAVLVTSGVHQGLVAAFQTLLRPGERAVSEAMTYTGINRIAAARGVSLVGARGDHDGIVPDEVDRLFTETDARVLVVTTCLQNPTARSLPLERRRQLAAVCVKHNARIIEDGVNVPLAADGLPSIAAFAPERTIHLTGLSKCVASGFRLGFATMPDAWLSSFYEALMAAQWIGPGFHAELALAMEASGALEQCVARHRAEAGSRSSLARKLLPTAGDGAPCYHLWVTAPSGHSAEGFCGQAAGAGIKISPGRLFAVDLSAPLGEEFRVSLGACDTRTELTVALTRLAQLMQQPEPAGMVIAPVV